MSIYIPSFPVEGVFPLEVSVRIFIFFLTLKNTYHITLIYQFWEMLCASSFFIFWIFKKRFAPVAFQNYPTYTTNIFL